MTELSGTGKIILEAIAYDELEVLKLNQDMDLLGMNFDDLIFVLERATSVHTVQITGECLACLHPDDRSTLIQTFGRLPNLQYVTLKNSPVMIWDLSMLLMQAVCLRSLVLEDLVFQGVFSHFIAFETSLMQHVDLKRFVMDDECVPANDDVSLNSLRSFCERLSAPMATGADPAAVNAQSVSMLA